MMKEFFSKYKDWVLGASALIAVFILFNLFGANAYDTYKIRQAPLTGKMSIITEPGMYWNGFADISTYDVSDDVEFKEEVTLSDGSKMVFVGSVKYRLPTDAEKRLLLHKDFGSYAWAKENLIRRNIADAFSNIAPMFVASDTYGARKPEIKALAEYYLQNGAIKTSTRIIQNKDGTSTRVAEIVRDKDGQPIVLKKSLLAYYGVEVQQVVMGDPIADAKVKALIDQQKEAEQQAVLARSQAEKARQDALTAKAQGDAMVAEAEAKARAEAITRTTQAKADADVAKLNAEKILAEGRATAEANRLKVAAGLTPLEKATIEKETRIGVAQALAGVKFPNSLIVSGGSGSHSANPFEAVGLQSLYELSKTIGTK